MDVLSSAPPSRHQKLSQTLPVGCLPRLYHVDVMDQITAIGDQLHLSSLGPSPLPEVGVKGGGVAESPNPLLTELIPWPPAPILRPFRSHRISIQRTNTSLWRF